MDPELKQALGEMEGRIFRHVDERVESVSRHVDERIESVSRHVDERIESVSRHVDERLDTFSQRLDGFSDHFEERLNTMSRHFEERIESTETKLLTAFHNWAQTYEVRARGTVAAVHEFEDRLGFVEERLNKLERARNGQKPEEPKG